AGAIALFVIPSKTSEDTSPTSTNPQSTGNPSVDALKDTIVVDAPAQNAQVTSPLAITGKARGNWYAEATAPIALLDQNGSVIAQGTIRAQGDWMTTDFVPFVGTLTYPDQPAGSV